MSTLRGCDARLVGVALGFCCSCIHSDPAQKNTQGLRNMG